MCILTLVCLAATVQPRVKPLLVVVALVVDDARDGRVMGGFMAAKVSRARLALVAYEYYVQEKSQAEIAAQLGLERSSVSRLIRMAREQRIVRFEIDFPLDRSTPAEHRLVSRFRIHGLREVIVVDREAGHGHADDSQAPLLAVARATVDWLATGLHDGETLGLSWGGTVQTVVDIAHFSRSHDVHVVQLVGELSLDSRDSGHDLVRDLALRVGGRYTYFNAPAVAQTAAGAHALLQTPQVSAALELARSVDVSLLGIGQYDTGSSGRFLSLAHATDAEREEALAKGVVGQALGRFYDATGTQADLSLHERTISLNIEDLRLIPTNVVVASGAEKRDALRAALEGGWVNVLIIDSALADAVIGTLTS